MKSNLFSLLLLLIFMNSLYGNEPMKEKLNYPECKNLSDVKKYSGQKVLINGFYKQTPVPGGKKLQAALIVLSDGTELIRSYRPVPKEFQFINKRVLVIGTVYPNAGQPDYVQQVMAPHIYLDSAQPIQLAEGETPYSEIPLEIPTLPLIEEKNNLDLCLEKWIHLHGTVVEIKPSKDASYLGEIIFRLKDGTLVIGQDIWLSQWEKLVNQEITLTTVVYLKKDSKEPVYLFYSGTHVCKGKKLRCGMDDVKIKNKKNSN